MKITFIVLLTFFSVLVFNATASSDLIAFWDFDNVSGWRADDQSGNDFHAYIARALPNVGGQKDFGLLFDGINSYVAINDDPLLDFNASDSFTISVWIKMDNDIKDWRSIIGKASNNSLNGYVLRHNQNGNLAMMVEDNSQSLEFNAIAQQDYRDGQWHHVVGVINRSNDTNSIYVDGYEKGEVDISGLGDLSNDFNFNIGSLQESGSISFKGIIDEIKIYGRALNIVDIQKLYGQQIDLPYPHGSLLQANNSYKVYYINSQGEKDWIINQEVFNFYHNKWEDVIKVDPGVLYLYPTQVKND